MHKYIHHATPGLCSNFPVPQINDACFCYALDSAAEVLAPASRLIKAYQRAPSHPLEVRLQLLLGFLGARYSKQHSVLPGSIWSAKDRCRYIVHACTPMHSNQVSAYTLQHPEYNAFVGVCGKLQTLQGVSNAGDRDRVVM